MAAKIKQGLRIRSSRFWLFAGLLSVILISPGLYYGINRPLSGLHSWAAASGRWAARSHVKYGLKYTQGLSTWAVGDPPVGEPNRYLDHPQLNVLLAAGAMKIFGINLWSTRVVGMTIAIATFIVFLKILRGLLD
ncbi:MAG: hypothetical protein DRP56_05590, partial [Planctomycetota bacterium]